MTSSPVTAIQKRPPDNSPTAMQIMPMQHTLMRLTNGPPKWKMGTSTESTMPKLPLSTSGIIGRNAATTRERDTPTTQ